MDSYIRHLVPTAYFHTCPADQPYQPEGFEREGFIHCTREPEVLLQIANTIFRDTPGEFLVLVLEPAKITAPVIDEPPIPAPPPNHPLAQHRFPHIYGPLNREAIVSIHPALRAPDGTFLAM